MFGLGPHAAFIVAAYGSVVVVLAGLILWIWRDYQTQKRLLTELESRGVRRRSAGRRGRSNAGR